MKMLDLSPILFLNVKTNGPVQVKQTKGDHAPSTINCRNKKLSLVPTIPNKMCFDKSFLGRMPIFRIKNHTNAVKLHNSTAIAKKPNTLAGFEPGSAVPHANAMTTSPRS
jgi:hypothetical protein